MDRKELVEWLEYFYTKDVKKIPNHGTATDAYKEIWAILKKPKVTEEWIKEKSEEFLIKTNISVQNPEAVKQQLKIIKDFIHSLIKESVSHKSLCQLGRTK